jgi:hypothetical protein
MAINLNLAAAAAQAVTPTFRASTQAAQTVVIDLSPQPAQAKVVREGFQVPAVALDAAKAGFFIDNLAQIDVRQEPRVVSQSVPPGTKVLPGTAVDLVLARTSDIPINIFQDPHRALQGQTLNALTDGILQDNTVRQTLLSFATAADVPAAAKTALTAQFNANGITIDEANADTGFAAAFNTARSALAFR